MSQSLLADIPGIEVMPPLADDTHADPVPESYVTSHVRGCLHWHTPNGDHYADVLQSNLLLANTGDHDRPEDPGGIRGGQLIQPLQQPAQLGAVPDMLPRANAVPDADMTLVALIEFHDGPAYWCCMCHDLHLVRTGQQQYATLAPMTETEFRGMF